MIPSEIVVGTTYKNGTLRRRVTGLKDNGPDIPSVVFYKEWESATVPTLLRWKTANIDTFSTWAKKRIEP
jgi:hypothetical protein